LPPKTAVLIAGLLCSAVPALASESLFARLVEASASPDRQALLRMLQSQTLSTSSATVGAGNRLSSTGLRHGVPATELAEKLEGCAVERWRDVGRDQDSAFILWHCPSKRVPGTECYFYSYRAELLNPRYHPPNLYIGEWPSWDHVRCGQRPPPAPPSPELQGERG
jgi:hypothetical protein